MTESNSAGGSVAYLLKRYPRLSETFILHEILELERQGVDLRLFSLLDPGEEITHSSVRGVRAPVTYLPTGRRAVGPLLRAHLLLLRRNPRRYLGVVGYILRKRRSRAALKHFRRSGWLALEMEALGVTHLHAHFAHGPASVAHFVHLLTDLSYSVSAHAKDIYTSPPDLLSVKLGAAQFVVTCTEYNARYLTQLVGSAATARVHRIYHGVDLRLFRPEADPDDGFETRRNTILAVGRLVEKKGFPYLIEAVRMLRAENYDVRLKIAGSGEMKDTLSHCIAEAGLEGCAELLGALPQEELIGLYRAATIVVLPSIVTETGDRDGIPNVLVEAMRLGRPVVSTDVSGIPELIIDGETGLLVPPRDAPALARALGRLLDDGALRRRLMTGGARHVTEEFDLTANTARLKSLLLEARKDAA